MFDQLARPALLVLFVHRSSEEKGDSGQVVFFGWKGRVIWVWNKRLSGRYRQGWRAWITHSDRRSPDYWQRVEKGGCVENKRGKTENKPLHFVIGPCASMQITGFKARKCLYIFMALLTSAGIFLSLERNLVLFSASQDNMKLWFYIRLSASLSRDRGKMQIPEKGQ